MAKTPVSKNVQDDSSHSTPLPVRRKIHKSKNSPSKSRSSIKRVSFKNRYAKKSDKEKGAKPKKEKKKKGAKPKKQKKKKGAKPKKKAKHTSVEFEDELIPQDDSKMDDEIRG
jgi:hypothetical protein